MAGLERIFGKFLELGARIVQAVAKSGWFSLEILSALSGDHRLYGDAYVRFEAP